MRTAEHVLPLRFRINHATVPTSEAHVRVTSAVNMMLSIPGATVTSFEFTPEGGRPGRASGPRGRPALSVWLQGHGHLFLLSAPVAGIWTWPEQAAAAGSNPPVGPSALRSGAGLSAQSQHFRDRSGPRRAERLG